jgi:hypothetical protein
VIVFVPVCARNATWPLELIAARSNPGLLPDGLRNSVPAGVPGARWPAIAIVCRPAARVPANTALSALDDVPVSSLVITMLPPNAK